MAWTNRSEVSSSWSERSKDPISVGWGSSAWGSSPWGSGSKYNWQDRNNVINNWSER